MTLMLATPIETFYNGLDTETAEVAVKALRPHSYRTFYSKLTYAAWRHVPSTYLVCTKDMAIPEAVQRLMIDATNKAGGLLRVMCLFAEV